MTAHSFHPSVLLLKSASPGEVILSHSDGDLDFLPPASDDRGPSSWIGKLIPTSWPEPVRSERLRGSRSFIVFQGLQINFSSWCCRRWILDCSKYSFDREDKDLNQLLIGRTYLGCHRGCHPVVVTSQWSRHQQFLTLNLSDSLSNLSGGRNSVRPD